MVHSRSLNKHLNQQRVVLYSYQCYARGGRGEARDRAFHLLNLVPLTTIVPLY